MNQGLRMTGWALPAAQTVPSRAIAIISRHGPVAEDAEGDGAGQEGRESVGKGHGAAAIEQGDVQRQSSVVEDLVADVPDMRVVMDGVVAEEDAG